MLRGKRADESRTYRAIRAAAARRSRITLAGLAITAALVATSPASGAPSPATIAPGGNITAVVKATDAQGWPHAVTRAEIIAVTDLALWHGAYMANRNERVAVRCYFGPTIARAHCGITYHAGKRRTAAFRVNVRVWEDGSYRFRHNR